MSELKWNWAYYPYLDPPEKQAESALKAGYIKVVNKDDVDKVITDLKDKGDKIIFDLKDKLQKESALLKETRDCLIESQKMHKRCADNAIKMIRHQKHKRCLDKVKWCDERIARYSLQQEIQGISWQKEIVFYRRLKNKFIEISKLFEEAK